MAITRAQSAAQKSRPQPAPKNQGKQPRGFQLRRNAGRERRYHESDPAKNRPRTFPTQPAETSPVQAVETSPTQPVKKTSGERATDSEATKQITDPIAIWAKEAYWPQELLHPKEPLTKSSSSLDRKRTDSAVPTTPSDQRPREMKSAQYRDRRYLELFAAKNSYAERFSLGIADESKRLCHALLETTQPVPKESLFDDDSFDRACEKLQSKNEARVIQDISRLIVPSAKQLSLRAQHLERLIEGVNEGWNYSVPLTGARPQPDYAVGFRRNAFTDDQLAKLSPFLGDFLAGDQSFFMGTYYMYFPFLTCEAKCSMGGIDISDHQNAHSMTLAVRGVAELFRMVKREHEIHRQILAFSISHDHQTVCIYGYYLVIDREVIKYYRHPIRTFNFTELEGKEKWTAYRVTRNICDIWMLQHFERICSAISQLPPELNFEVSSLSEAARLS
ncbi:hypothetical protein B0J13DRAFT_650443 [Dactylonectria estremocensis]|uniref:DUF7924 domain-containing protein n=1 Tax=Dactylonectria estremocensis TaxID=1079267 RepID=A0A9P9FAQ7_9HYPO|nr:hypothetical protein B0J13DRAFT_650443 [Dactylonectria estremocensis]